MAVPVSRAARITCARCLRPGSLCCCALLAPVATATRVIFLQHPRERRVRVSTCRLAHLALANSELRHGVSFDADPHVRMLADDAACRPAVLFPGEGAIDPAALPAGPPRTLFVIDGTWGQARQILARSAVLAGLPRLALTPARPGRYRIRREPAAHCMSTIEAVAEVLGQLEGDGSRFAPMLRAFDEMVEEQIRRAAARPRPYRHTRRRPRPEVVTTLLGTRAADLVLVQAEANAQPADGDTPGATELVQLVAVRPASGERFIGLVAPRRALVPTTPHHLEVPAASLLGGEPVESAMTRWRAFVRAQDLFCVWGRHTVQLLRAEGAPERPLVDLRDAVTRRLGRRAGGVEQAAVLLGADTPHPWAEGRGGRRIAALAAVLASFRRRGESLSVEPRPW